MRALLIAIACFLAGPIAAAAQTASSPKRTVDLTRMGSSIEDTELDTRFKFGLACVTDRSVKLRNLAERFDDPGLRSVFREAMADAGIRAPREGGGGDLFTGPRGGSDLQVGAMIRSLRMETCTRTNLRNANTEGSARLEIQWQVYSSEESKVVAKVTTYGSFSTDASADRIIERLLSGAFKRAARDFADDPTFQRIVKTGEAKRESTVPLTPLSISVPPSRATPIAQAGQAVVSIVVADGHGSGVLVSSEGYILTNRHVAGDSGKVRVVWADGSESPGLVLRANRKRDVALVKVEAPKAQPLTIRHETAQLGETVFAIGTPLQTRLAGTLTRGIVSGLRIADGQPFIQSDVVINGGNSGGPLLDEKGQIIGLTVSGFDAGGAPMGINFFIPIDDGLKVLAITAVAPAAAPPPRPAPRPRPPALPPARAAPRR